MTASFRIVRVPDRWDIVVALLAAPSRRPPVEFWIRRPRAAAVRAVPVFVIVDSLAHGISGVLEVTGVLTEASHVWPNARVLCRFVLASAAGEMLVDRS